MNPYIKMVFTIYDAFTIYVLVEAVWLVLPAYAANGLAPLARGKRMVDGGRKLWGQPIFGTGKTWEGLLLGTCMGGVIGLVQQLAYPYLPWSASPVLLQLAPMTWLLGLFLGLGAMLGDMAGAFVKRRLQMPRGQSAPIMDQLDFIAGSLVLASLLAPIRLEWVILLAVMTPFLHLTANIIAYMVKLKKEPW